MRHKRILWIAVVVVLVLAAYALFAFFRTAKTPVEQPRTAAVVTVTRGNLASSLTIAGQFQPYQQVDLHAKVSGFIRWIGVDIGDKVHQGQVLAKLEVPELQDQYQGAQADVRHTQSEINRAQSEVLSAQSTYSALHAEYTRLAEASKQRPGLIAEQELDDARAKDQQASAQISVAKASLEAMQQELGVSNATSHRFQTLTNYEEIVAPFNGVVTMRYADTGSLIQAGQDSNTQTLPVVQVAQSDLLRLRMPVPESDVPYIAIGGDVQVKISSTGRLLTGKIVRFTRALDTNTRTMLTEVDVPNPDLVLDPGMYAETTIQLQQRNDTLILPSQAIVQDGDQSYVLVVTPANRVERRNVTLGIQTSNRSEITGGLHAGDMVIASGQTSYQPGDLVSPHAAFIPTAAQEVSE
ncbi:efflux RND transporter periplasmic adaptor subunit [Granulicella sp. L46]|jgi:RND family efflux transporter MFP subunit|uniref:efflux RND transporter periplasmic adaptor subunit n=1 Tax=Granulicella sp. L46 TaxID=1641865 RepID=UPI00131DD735|nr:efflux RND transporter periplasmic adaptor subunit [Granulicella sp. L46]